MSGYYGSPSVTVTLDDAQGGSGQAITNFVLELSGIKITQNFEPSTAFGDSWEESLPTAVGRLEDVTITGHWNTTALHGYLNDPDNDPNSGSRTLVVVFGDSKTMTVEGWLMDYEVLAQVGQLTRFTVTFHPTGTPTWS